VRLPTLVIRMLRAVKLDKRLYEELGAETTATRQAFVIVVLASLATGIGAGVAGVFTWAGLWSVWSLLIGLAGSLVGWLIWSIIAYIIGINVFKGSRVSATKRGLLRAVGFSISPAVLGIFLFTPVIGGILWLGSSIWTLTAGIVAVRQTLGLNTCRAILTYLTSWFICVLTGILSLTLLSVYLLGGGCTLGNTFDTQLNTIVKSYRFSIPVWEISSLRHEFSQLVHSRDQNLDNPPGTVVDYFATTEDRDKSLQDTVEKILENQIKDALIQEHISGFPPVNLRLTTLPRLLVISPRDRIESIREIMLQPNLSLEQIESIEAQVDKLGVSSLIVRLGGFAGAYPSFVSNSDSLCFTIETAVEEWIHQYLAFKPLGFRYILDLLGVSRNYEVATMNETAAGIISEEIGKDICDRYYQGQSEVQDDRSDFDREMREIRLAVDEHLARGEIEAAEQFMEQKRQLLNSEGYRVRKLNQAYFAWHGTYADEASSVSPIGVELRELRSKSGSVREFLEAVAEMTSRQDLKERVEALR
jgi:hypothetical protein